MHAHTHTLTHTITHCLGGEGVREPWAQGGRGERGMGKELGRGGGGRECKA